MSQDNGLPRRQRPGHTAAAINNTRLHLAAHGQQLDRLRSDLKQRDLALASLAEQHRVLLTEIREQLATIERTLTLPTLEPLERAVSTS